MPRPLIALAAIVLSLAAAESAGAATQIGSPEVGAPPDAFACAACPAGSSVGFRQLALQDATLEAPEAGVLVSVRAYVKRIAGSAQPVIAVLRPGDGIAATIVGRAPLPASSTAGALVEVRDLHLPVQAGDTLGVLLPAGQADLGVRTRPQPDGAIVSFTAACMPCGTNAGTGVELLLEGTVEPDADEDLLGDESQDPDLGGAVFEDPFADESFDDDERLEDDAPARRRRQLRLLRVTRQRDGGATLLLAAPRAGRLAATATARRTMIARGRTRSNRAGRVRLRLRPRPVARRMLARPLRTRLVVNFRGRRAITRKLTLERKLHKIG